MLSKPYIRRLSAQHENAIVVVSRNVIMTSASNASLAQLKSDLFAAVEKDHELRASLAAIAERIHEQSDTAENISILEWREWLEDEGYDISGLKKFIARVLDNEFVAEPIRTIKKDACLGKLISLTQNENSNILESIFDSIDYSLKIHEELLGLAGGTATARPPVGKALKIGQKKKGMATKEAAAESAMSMSREASPLSDGTSVMGRDGGG